MRVRGAGASYVVAALQHTTTLKLLDLSGNNVSADTCMVLQESLKVGSTMGRGPQEPDA